VPDLPATSSNDTGPAGTVAQAVQCQLDALETADEPPGTATIALAMARLLDNPLALPQHPAAAGRLVEILGRLSKGSQRPGRLASVRSMTSRS
jgi:hypothetical protein